jgi:cytochrome P450
MLCGMNVNYNIPKKWLVWVAPYVVHMNPKFSPNPMAFDPSRFQVSSYIQNYYSRIIYSYNQLLISPIILT